MASRRSGRSPCAANRRSGSACADSSAAELRRAASASASVARAYSGCARILQDLQHVVQRRVERLHHDLSVADAHLRGGWQALSANQRVGRIPRDDWTWPVSCASIPSRTAPRNTCRAPPHIGSPSCRPVSGCAAETGRRGGTTSTAPTSRPDSVRPDRSASRRDSKRSSAYRQ